MSKVRLLDDFNPFGELSGDVLHEWLASPEVGGVKFAQLIAKHGLLIFRNAKLTPAQEVAISKLPGWHEPSPPKTTNFGWNSHFRSTQRSSVKATSD